MKSIKFDLKSNFIDQDRQGMGTCRKLRENRGTNAARVNALFTSIHQVDCHLLPPNFYSSFTSRVKLKAKIYSKLVMSKVGKINGLLHLFEMKSMELSMDV